MKYLILLLLSLLLATPSFAADKKVILQISDDNIQKQVLVLNVAENLLQQYGKELKLEIVAFGPGLNLFTANSNYAQRLHKLSTQGVKLSACQNTAAKMSKLVGKEIALQQQVEFVNGGAARIVELIEQGYILIRP